MSKNQSYTNALLENIQGQNQAVLEAVSGMQTHMQSLTTKAELRAVATEVKIIREVVTANHKDFLRVEKRVSRIESQLAAAK